MKSEGFEALRYLKKYIRDDREFTEELQELSREDAIRLAASIRLKEEATVS